MDLNFGAQVYAWLFVLILGGAAIYLILWGLFGLLWRITFPRERRGRDNGNSAKKD